jgi:hypothetical protein
MGSNIGKENGIRGSGSEMRLSPDRKIALGFAVVGIVLMALTIAWRINPVEGSVVPTFLTDSPVGRAVVRCLLVTCMPAWILSVWLTTILPIPDPIQYPLTCGLMILLQAVAYGLVGKGIAAVYRQISEKN